MSRLKRPDHAVATDFPIGLHHCDMLGVAWHGRYFEWLEMARMELFKSRNLDIPEIRASGNRMYVVDAQCRYMAPLSYGDVARVNAWFVTVAPLIKVAYDIHNPATGRWCARAITVLATTDIDGNLLLTTPDALLARLPVR